MERPIFVKGNLEFTLHNELVQLKNINISLFGVTSLPWNNLSPESDFGKKVIVNLRIALPQPIHMVADAILMKENTRKTELMTIKFDLTKANRDKLAQLIEKHGFFPPENLRKYPRIPSSEDIQTFPLRVVGNPVNKKLSIDEEDFPIVFSVEDMSLGGILISTENPYALSITAGSYIQLFIEPRGDFSIPISLQGQVCRLMDEIHPRTGNLVRYFGLPVSYTHLTLPTSG